VERKGSTGAQKKSPFVVAIVHHRLCSPVRSTTNITTEKKKKTTVKVQKYIDVKKGITKVTEKRLLAKAENIERKQKTTSAKKKSATNSEDKKSFAL